MLTGVAHENSSAWYRGTLRDKDKVVVPLTDIVSFTLVALYNGAVCETPVTIINSRANILLVQSGIIQPAVNGMVMNYYTEANDALTPAEPVWEVEFTPDDNEILDELLSYESHLAHFKCVFANGTREWEVGLQVENFRGAS